VRPLCEPLKNNPTRLIWSKEAQNAFQTLKQDLMKAPALGLPDVTKRFWLFSSKQLDGVSKGWPGCLQAVAAVVLTIQEAWKFTLDQKITVPISHRVSAVLQQKGNYWLSPSLFPRYQATLIESKNINIVVTNITNPASFLSGSISEPSVHDCLETIETVYSSKPDLKEEPLIDAQDPWFTDGSSIVGQGIWKARYAVTTADEAV